MDSPELRLLLRPDNQKCQGYLGWMLQNGLSLSVSEPETPTGFIQEPEPDTTKAPKTKGADQSTVKTEADMNLIDLWSADPIPTQVPTLTPLSSSPVPSGLLEAPVPSGDLPLPMSLSDFVVPSPPLVLASSLDSSALLVSSSSSTLPPLLAPCGSSASPQAPPARYCAESLTALRPSRPMSPPRPVSPLTPLRLCTPSSPPRPICPRTPLGSLVHLDKPRSVVARPSIPSDSLGSSLPLVSLRLRSLHRRPSQPNPRLGHASQLLHLGLPPPLISFQVSPSPLTKAPPWFLPPSAPPWCWSPLISPGSCPSTSPHPPPKPAPLFLLSIIYCSGVRSRLPRGGANVMVMFSLVQFLSCLLWVLISCHGFWLVNPCLAVPVQFPRLPCVYLYSWFCSTLCLLLFGVMCCTRSVFSVKSSLKYKSMFICLIPLQRVTAKLISEE